METEKCILCRPITFRVFLINFTGFDWSCNVAFGNDMASTIKQH
jgi:hypothetical protein